MKRRLGKIILTETEYKVLVNDPKSDKLETNRDLIQGSLPT